MLAKYAHTFAILAYKDSSYLEECILSVLQQTQRSNIFIATSTPSRFLDDLSRKYGIPVLINSNSRGIAHDWSFAYSKCETEYVTLAHQDDIYLPEYTESCLAAVNRQDGRNKLIIFTNYRELSGAKIRKFDPNRMIKKIILTPFLFKQDISSYFLKRLMLSFGDPIQCASVMYSKNNIGALEFSEEFQCNMDWDAWLKLAERKGSFIYIRKILMYHRIHPDSQTTLSIENEVRKREEEMILSRLWPARLARFLATIYSFAIKSHKTG